MRGSMRLIVVCLGLLALGSPAQAALDAATEGRIGGAYSNACNDRSQLMIRLFGDTLDIERGGSVVHATRVRADRTPPADAPPDFKAAVRGEARGAAVALTLTHNAQGLFARIDGSERALAPLGAGVAGQVLRHCDPNCNALPGHEAAAGAAGPQGPTSLLADRRFRAAWTTVLGPLAKERWIARLEGPAPPLRELGAGGASLVLGAACKPHDCRDNSLVFVWNRDAGTVSALIQQGGRRSLVGTASPLGARELERLWTEEWRQR
ncbi:Ivy family c-type lysozyme inhibitor [Piscinibacter koreensis]|uniref:Inhibitor of lysozyme (Ivy) n=1 Tax=Piscinibacter koreensis TaxID=2742824 RepID=A0A7Y6NR99_9BURK|nr:Ivy family c-type lysozyme inhibitor [Schlegelella koreensis]NUZ07854.1 hypothetical protein [Schlegelella koreensis]